MTTDRIIDGPAYAMDVRYTFRPDGTTVSILTTHKGSFRTGTVRSFSVTLSPAELRALRDSAHEALLRADRLAAKKGIA